MVKIAEYIDRNRQQPGDGRGSFTETRYVQMVREIDRDCKLIVDIGCNTGVGAASLRQGIPRAKLFGLDCVPERLVEAARVYDFVAMGSATSIPLADGSVDAVLAGELIEHLSEQDANTLASEAFRVLRPGGRLVLTTPNPSYLRLRMTGRSVLDDPAHLSEFTPGRLKEMLGRAGFEVCRVRGTGRVSNYAGRFLPFLCLYGSYMLTVAKPAS